MSSLPALGLPSDLSKANLEQPEETVQIVTFTLGEETFGLDIMMVREFRVWSETNALPNTPDFMLGVINLRGLIVPVVDLRQRFARGRTEPSKSHVIIVVVLENAVMGLLVDTVSDIVTFPKSEIRPVPAMEYKGESDFLLGLVTLNQQVVSLVEPAMLFKGASMQALAAATNTAATATS